MDALVREAGGLMRRRRDAGFTYLGLMFLVALFGILLALAGQHWHTLARRDKELELLFVGKEFTRALERYHARHAGLPDQFPKKLEDLLEDRNQNPPQRYLRQIYRDPLTGKAEWGLVRNPREGIIGIYSLADGVPIKHAGFPGKLAQFAEAENYRDWLFTYSGEDVPLAGAGLGAPPPSVDPGTPQIPEVPPPVPPVVSKPRDPPKRDCAKISARDFQICEEQRARWGSQTVSDCQASAQARLSACIANTLNLPALYIRYQ